MRRWALPTHRWNSLPHYSEEERVMSTRADARAVSYEEACFQDVPGLFTSLRVDRKTLPGGVHRYEIREEGGVPCQLAKGIAVDHYGTLITTDPIQLPADGYLSFQPEELILAGGAPITMERFQEAHPPTGRDVIELQSALPEEAPFFFSWDDGRDVTNGCIGHVRGDFEGKMLHHTWCPHHWDEMCNNALFKADLERVVAWLRTGFAPLRDLNTMRAFCNARYNAAIPNEAGAYGFRVETKRYRYMLRCTPLDGCYHVYLYCYSKEAAQ